MLYEVITDLTTVVADVDARMTGGMLQNPTIAGTADIEQWEIRLPEKLARPLNPIRVTHRNAPADLAATLAAEDEEPANVITSYSIHYTKLYDFERRRAVR